jgi:hypothetical protein
MLFHDAPGNRVKTGRKPRRTSHSLTFRAHNGMNSAAIAASDRPLVTPLAQGAAPAQSVPDHGPFWRNSGGG